MKRGQEAGPVLLQDFSSSSRMSRPRKEDWIILGILVASVAAVYAALEAVNALLASDPDQRHWVREG